MYHKIACPIIQVTDFLARVPDEPELPMLTRTWGAWAGVAEIGCHNAVLEWRCHAAEPPRGVSSSMCTTVAVHRRRQARPREQQLVAARWLYSMRALLMVLNVCLVLHEGTVEGWPPSCSRTHGLGCIYFGSLQRLSERGQCHAQDGGVARCSAPMQMTEEQTRTGDNEREG